MRTADKTVLPVSVNPYPITEMAQRYTTLWKHIDNLIESKIFQKSANLYYLPTLT